MNKEEIEKIVYLLKDINTLYVEDDKSQRVGMENFFKNLNLKIDTAENGEVAISKFKDKSYDLVISDIKMPKVSGIDLAKVVKNISPNTIFIALSAFNDEDYLMEALNIGIDRYLKKPLSIDIFLDSLNEMAKRVLEKKENRKKDKIMMAKVAISDEFYMQIRNINEHEYIKIVKDFIKKYENIK